MMKLLLFVNAIMAFLPYDVKKFPVKGKDIHPLYAFLTEARLNGVRDSKVTWNFQKYLIGTNGRLEKVIAPRTLPDDEEVVSWITGE